MQLAKPPILVGNAEIVSVSDLGDLSTARQLGNAGSRLERLTRDLEISKAGTRRLFKSRCELLQKRLDYCSSSNPLGPITLNPLSLSE